MPSTKKRINLTVPDVIYEQLQKYKEDNGITNDAGACLQLIVQQLRSVEQSQIMMKAFMSMSPEEAAALSAEGAKTIHHILEQQTGKQQ